MTIGEFKVSRKSKLIGMTKAKIEKKYNVKVLRIAKGLQNET